MSLSLILVARWSVLLCLSFSAFAQFENQFLSFGEAEKLWNMEPFDAAKFRASRQEDRAGMALDLINRGQFTNKKLADVKKALGSPDGHFETRYALAYQLGSDDKNYYQLIFLPDFSGKLVENIKIYHEPVEDPSEAPPPPKPAASASAGGISAQPKRLPIDIDGAVAESIFNHMKRSPTIKNVRTGKNIVCSKSASKYHCSFQIDEDGTIQK